MKWRDILINVFSITRHSRNYFSMYSFLYYYCYFYVESRRIHRVYNSFIRIARNRQVRRIFCDCSMRIKVRLMRSCNQLHFLMQSPDLSLLRNFPTTLFFSPKPACSLFLSRSVHVSPRIVVTQNCGCGKKRSLFGESKKLINKMTSLKCLFFKMSSQN